MRRHRGGLTAHHNRAEPRYSRPGAPIHPEQPRGTKATTTRLTIAGNRKFESTSLQGGVQCELPRTNFHQRRSPPGNRGRRAEIGLTSTITTLTRPKAL